MGSLYLASFPEQAVSTAHLRGGRSVLSLSLWPSDGPLCGPHSEFQQLTSI